ncbi:hypothetical protein ACFX14_037950 [Malus domestica]
MEKRRKIQSETSFLLLELFCPSITTLPDNGVDSDESDDDHMIEEWMDFGSDLTKLLSDCITAFKDNAQYRDDIRFLKIWFLYMDTSEDFESVFSGNVAQGDLCWPILGGNGLACSVANSREMLQGRLALIYGKYGDEFEVV